MDNLSHLIWDEYDRINDRLNTEAGLERFPEIRFKREYTIFRPGHFTADRIFELNDKMELPTNSIIHVLDNISHLDEEPMDIPRLEEHPLIDQESFRKYIYHVRNFTTDGPLLYEDKYIFRQSGLPAHLLKFRSQNGSRFRYPLTIDELPSRREVLLIINHNPLFRARFFGRLQTFRKLTLIWTSLLNTVCRLASLKKNQYISIPWGEEIYPKNLFIRNRDVLTYSTVKYPEDPHYFIMMHLINFLWKDASTSIFRQLPEDVLQQLNLILTLNGKYVIFNLAEIQQMNDKNRIYYRFINLLNMLSVLGRPVDTADKKKLLEDHFDQSGVSSSMYENNTEIATIEPKESVTESSESEYVKDNNAEEVLIKIAETIPSSQPKPLVIRNIQPSPISIVPLSKQELQQPKQLISVPKNVTGIKRTQQNSKGIEEFTQDFLKETDKETNEFIERQEHLTLPQKKRYQRLSNKYKELTLDGVPLQKIMLQNSDISLEPAVIDPKKMGYLPDESACTSSVLTFDHSYLKKSFNKHLVETITGFRKQGVFLTDIKTRHENDRMNNFIHYTLKYEDINGKQSTVKFRLPQINRDGRLRIDGKYHVLKKQRINLPIVKISDTEVSLSSNYNKTRVERNTNKAHNFFAFIDNLINSDKSSAIIEFGKCATNLPLPYEYSCLAERYRSISFVQNNISWQLWFDYNNRADHFDDKEDKLLLLEKEYGIYIGKTQDEWLFMDANCQIRSVYKNNGENPQFSYATLTDILRESLKEGETIAKKAVTEWVNVKILDKMLPVIFLLGFQYGLRNTLDYLGIEYTITEARNKTIVGTSASENTPVVGNESISGSVFSLMLWFLRLFYSSWARLNKYEDIVYYWCNGMVDPKKGKFIFRSVLLCYFDPKENKPAKYLQTFPELTHKEYNIVVPRRLPIIKTWKGNFLYIDDILKLLPDFARDLKKRTKIDSKYKRLLDKNLYAFYWNVHKTLISYLESKGCEFYVDKTIKEHEDLHGNKYRSGKESFDFDLDDIANYTDPLIAQEALEDLDEIKYTPKPGDIAIRFADRTLWFNRYPLEKSLIVCGLEYFDCSQYSLADFESKDIYYQLLVDKNMSTNYLKGISSFFDLFVDGMTYEVLRKMHEPTTFRDLLIRSAQLLSTTDFLPPSSKENHRIRGFEQLNAIIYNEMSRQLAAYQAKRGKANVFTINPDAVFLRVISNASLVASEGANPLQCVKEATYMTYAGIGGRSADSFVLRDRAYSPDDIGIISEATVDNQKVAINAQLSMNSGIVDTIGTLETKNIKDLQPADVLSNTALVFPFSTMDDRFCPAEK